MNQDPNIVFSSSVGQTAIQTSSKLSQAGLVLAIAIGTILLDGFLVAWVWGTGVDFATLDRVSPGGSGFQINPLPIGYKWLLGAVLVANIGLLYSLARKKWQYALGFAVGAIVPMGYIILILA